MNAAEGTWPYSIDEICYAINMGVGRPVVGYDSDNCVFQLGGIGSDVTIQLFYEDDFTTTVVVESEQIFSNNGFNPFLPNILGINFDAVANRSNVQNVMDRIIANLNSMEINREPVEDEYYDEEYYDEDNDDESYEDDDYSEQYY